MSLYRREAYTSLWLHHFYIGLSGGGFEVSANVDKHEQRHDLSGSQRQ